MSSVDFANYEAYLLADNKEQFLGTLIPGSQAYFFFTFLHALKSKSPLPMEIELQLDEYIHSSFDEEPAKKISLMYYLKKYDSIKNDEDAASIVLGEINDFFFNLNFNHTKPSNIVTSTLQAGQSKLSSKLDPEILSLDKQINKAYNEPNAIQLLKPSIYHKLDLDKIASGRIDTFDYFMATADPTEFEDYVDLAVKNMKRHSKEALYCNSRIVKRMTHAQLKEFGKACPDLYKNTTFVTEVFLREFNVPAGGKIGADLSKEARRELLLKVYNWALDLPPVTRSIAYEALDEILQLGIKLNKFSKDLFLEYIKNPSRVYSWTT